jgi:proteasome lid subunit RPN8/RPN11
MTAPLDCRATATPDLASEAFPTVQHAFRILLDEAAFDRIVERGEASSEREVGGVLVGRVLRDGAGPYVRVETTIDALHAEEKGAELTFTHATWDHIHQEMDRTHPTRRIVGWYHTHPGFGIFLSERDQFIHKSFFNLPFQIAVVYDPKSREHGVFCWRDSEPLRWRSYCVGSREHLWDGGRAESPTRAQSAPVAGEPDPGPGGSLDLGWRSMLGIGGVALLATALIALWLGGRLREPELDFLREQVRIGEIRGMQATLDNLNSDLLTLLRQSLDGSLVQGKLAPSLQELDEVAQTLRNAATPPAGREAALAKLSTARDRIARFALLRSDAEVMLANLERRSGTGSLSPDLSSQLAKNRLYIGKLYADVASEAARAGNLERARMLLTLAAQIDPGNQGLYQKTLQQLGPPGPAASAGAPPAPEVRQ